MALTVLLAAWWAFRLPTGFPLDDAWIHQVVARQFAEHGTLTFGPGSKGGSTSLLWSLFLAAPHALGFDTSGVVLFTRALGVLLLVVAVQALYDAARSDGWTSARSWGFAAGAAASGNVLWFAFSGMETALVLALTSASVAAWRHGTIASASLLSAALVLTRPEGVLVPLVMAILERRKRRQVALVSAALAGSVLLASASWWLSGSPMPSTLAGRRWLYGFDGGPSVDQRVLFMAHWAVHLLRFSSGSMIGLGLLLGACAAAAVWDAWRTRALGVLTLCACALAVTVLYGVVLPVVGHGGRYQPLNAWLFTALAAAGAAGLAARLKSGRALMLPAAAVAVLTMALATGWQWRGILRDGITHIETTQHAMGRWLRDRLPRDRRVAVFDIGAIGYEIGPQLADISGLTDPAAVTRLRSGTLPGYLREQGIDQAVLPSHNPRSRSAVDILGMRASDLRLERVHTEATSPTIWASTWESTYAAWPAQTLYRLVWDDARREGQ
jgi:hypothetical protein